jgi:hypothetical protein
MIKVTTMKKSSCLLVFAGCILFSLAAFAGQNNSQPIMAERKGAAPVDLFKAIGMESLLAIPTGEKLISYEMVLSARGEILKYSYGATGDFDFKHLMAKLKEHATPGCILFIDHIESASGLAITPVKFDLK